MFTKRFLMDAAERAICAFCGALAGALGAGATDFASVSWKGALITAGLAALSSVLFSIGASQQTNSISPASFTPPA